MTTRNRSRRSSISPEFVDCSVRIYNGKSPVRCKITEGKVSHKFGEFAFYTETKTFEHKYWTGKKGKSLSTYVAKRKSDFGKT